MSYTAGSGVRVSAAFTDSTGAAVDPTTITLSWKDPGGTVTTWTYGGTGSIVRDSTGNYHAVIDTTGKAGVWIYEWQGTGSVLATADAAFSVAPLPI